MWEEYRNVPCLDRAVFGSTPSCHFRVMAAQTEHEVKVRDGNLEGPQAHHVVRPIQS